MDKGDQASTVAAGYFLSCRSWRIHAVALWLALISSRLASWDPKLRVICLSVYEYFVKKINHGCRKIHPKCDTEGKSEKLNPDEAVDTVGSRGYNTVDREPFPKVNVIIITILLAYSAGDCQNPERRKRRGCGLAESAHVLAFWQMASVHVSLSGYRTSAVRLSRFLMSARLPNIHRAILKTSGKKCWLQTWQR